MYNKHKIQVWIFNTKNYTIVVFVKKVLYVQDKKIMNTNNTTTPNTLEPIPSYTKEIRAISTPKSKVSFQPLHYYD